MLHRFVGSLSVPNGKGVKLDDAELNLRLLLTDKVILNTHRLAEVNDLVRLFGMKGLMALLEEGKLSLTCEAFSFGFRHDLVNNEHEFMVQTVQGAPIQRDWYLRTAFQENVRANTGVAALSKDVWRYIEEPPGAESDQNVRRHLHSRMTNDHELVRQAICVAAQNSECIPDWSPDTLDFDIKQSRPETLAYEIRTNLPASLTVEQRRQIIASAVSAITNTGMRIDAMERHQALTESKETDLPLLDAHTRFIERALAQAQPIDQFRRVVSIVGPRSPARITRVNARKVIDAAKSAECLEFRRWLEVEAPKKSDEEIQKYFQSWSAKTTSFLGGNVGKSLKWIAVNATQMALDAAFPGMQAGFMLGALDAFLLDKVIKPGGPVVFLNQTYPSLFTAGPGSDHGTRAALDA